MEPAQPASRPSSPSVDEAKSQAEPSVDGDLELLDAIEEELDEVERALASLDDRR